MSRKIYKYNDLKSIQCNSLRKKCLERLTNYCEYYQRDIIYGRSKKYAGEEAAKRFSINKQVNIQWVATPQDGFKLYNKIRFEKNDIYTDTILQNTDLSTTIKKPLIESIYHNISSTVSNETEMEVVAYFMKELKQIIDKGLMKSITDNIWPTLVNVWTDSIWIGVARYLETVELTEYNPKVNDTLWDLETIIRSCAGMYIIDNDNIILIEKL